MLFDLENPKHIGVFAICMILLTLGILLTLSIAMHNLVNGQEESEGAITAAIQESHETNNNNSTITDYNDPNIPTIIHDNDTDP
jgi:hypothetical protein